MTRSSEPTRAGRWWLHPLVPALLLAGLVAALAAAGLLGTGVPPVAVGLVLITLAGAGAGFANSGSV
ncbi:MAG: hypothetical protein L0I76_14780 [Pseudonocardia sp.]|nr:hypothetical protein [Pseudonocardia sp.]